MPLIFFVLADIIHLANFVVLGTMFFGFRRREFEHESILYIILWTAMGGISAFIYWFDRDYIETALYIIALVVFMCLMYKERILKVIIIVFWMVLFLYMLDAMIAVLFDIEMDLLGINGESISYVGVSSISLLLVYVVGVVYKKNTATGMASFGAINLVWYTLLMAINTYVVITLTSAELVPNNYRSLYLATDVFIIVGILIQLAAVILLVTQRNVYKEKKLLTEKYLDEQKNYYEYLENREQETKKFRHDFRSHLEMISFLAKNHEYEKIDSYLEQMNIRIDELRNKVTVHNGTVDAILNQYYARAMQQGIHMEVKGRLPGNCVIDAYDLCTIFSNVLSNALEACVDTEEKYMSLVCGYTENSIVIMAKNSFDSERKKEGTWLKSRKENVNYHGFGLENMKDSIDKYHGFYEIMTNNNIFTLTIIFNNERKNAYENINSR